MDWRPISADSHITEPPNCYIDNIDPAWRDRAPRLVDLGEDRVNGKPPRPKAGIHTGEVGRPQPAPF